MAAEKSLEDLISPLKKEIMEAVPHSSGHEHSDDFMTKRDEVYKGKTIEIYTTYRILIDGKPLESHTQVMNNGTVHNHSLPQYSFKSAVDMVKKIIDTFDVELPEDELAELYEGNQDGN